MCESCNAYFKEAHAKSEAILKEAYGEGIMDQIRDAGFVWNQDRGVYERRLTERRSDIIYVGGKDEIMVSFDSRDGIIPLLELTRVITAFI